MEYKDEDLTYNMIRCGKRCFIVDNEAMQKGDTCATPEEMIEKCMKWGILDKLSLLVPHQSLLEKILESYPLQEIEPVIIDDDLRGYIEFLTLEGTDKPVPGF